MLFTQMVRIVSAASAAPMARVHVVCAPGWWPCFHEPGMGASRQDVGLCCCFQETGTHTA